MRGVLEPLPCAARDFIFAATRALDYVAIEVHRRAVGRVASAHEAFHVVAPRIGAG